MFIGNKEITQDGNLVTFENGNTRTLTDRNQYLVTEEPTDATSLQKLVIEEMSKDFLEELQKFDYTKYIDNEADDTKKIIEELQLGFLKIMQDHDVEVGNRKKPDSTFEAVLNSVMLKHTNVIQKALINLSYTIDDTFDGWISRKMGFDKNESTDSQMRRIRVSDILS